MAPLLVVVNSTGSQSTSVIRAASAAGFNIRAQVRSATKPEAKLLAGLPNVTLIEGSLDDQDFVKTLFKDADCAWVNTTYLQQNETEVGKALALAAKEAEVKHYVYSSLANHSKITNGKWCNPIWAAKYAVEEYIRNLDNFPATFAYIGAYLENYNKVMPITKKTQEDGTIIGILEGKFDENVKLNLIEIERDLGPAIVKILQDGPEKWNHKRVPLAFHRASSSEVVKILSEAAGYEITYKQISKEFDPTQLFDIAMAILNEEVYFDWDARVPEEARELNPNYHSIEDFAKDTWKKPQ